jgi:hypothetical protein
MPSDDNRAATVSMNAIEYAGEAGDERATQGICGPCGEAAAAATQVSANLKLIDPDMQSGMFCSKLVPGMDAMLKPLCPGLSPTVQKR